MLGPLPDGRMQSVADRKLNLKIVNIEGDLAQLVKALRLRHFRGEAELLQERVGPGEKFALALGLGVRMRFSTRLGEWDNATRHFLLSVAKRFVIVLVTVVPRRLTSMPFFDKDVLAMPEGCDIFSPHLTLATHL